MRAIYSIIKEPSRCDVMAEHSNEEETAPIDAIGDAVRRGLSRRRHFFQLVTHDLLDFKEAILIVLTPIVSSPLLFSDNQALHCAYCVVVMGVYWMFEVMPLAATALMPTFMFPIIGILSAAQTSTQYLTHLNFLFIGGLIVALAVEKSNLHQRIALRVLTIVGSQPKWIMLGFMLTTAFLSMWMSNTATAAMMVPIAQSVIQELMDHSKRKLDVIEEDETDKDNTMRHSLMRHEITTPHTGSSSEGPPPIKFEDAKKLAQRRRSSFRRRSSLLQVMPHLKQKETEPLNIDDMSPKDRNIAKALMISIAFAANIGGTGTITGTPPNLVLIEQFEKKYKAATGLISFLAWMEFAIPLMFIAVFVCWLCLVIVFMGMSHLADIFRKEKVNKSDPSINALIQQKYVQLPRMSFAECQVLLLFLFLLALWIFRDPQVIPGFGAYFKPGFYKDGTSAMLAAVCLFILPDKVPAFLCFRSCAAPHRRSKSKIRGTLMDWPTMQHKFPWSVVLLLGGGFALAEGVNKSGLSEQIGKLLQSLEDIPEIGLQIICFFATIFVTNICSNTVTAVIFLQIVAEMAENLGIHPLSFMLPTVLACSYAFLLPVATPPNAIVFASGLLTVGDMMKAGIVVTAVCAIMILLYVNTYGRFMWDLATMPDWATAQSPSS